MEPNRASNVDIVLQFRDFYRKKITSMGPPCIILMHYDFFFFFLLKRYSIVSSMSQRSNKLV
jgi:hypothetical protein